MRKNLGLLVSVALIQLATISPAARAGVNVYFVGGDGACPFSNIQDAIDAAAAHPGPDFVWLAMDEQFTGQHVRISDADRVVIEGGFVDCADNDIDTALTTVSGSGNDGGAVFEVHGSSASDVYFKNVFITGADRNGDANGGGIDFYGAGKLTLEQSSVSINSAGYGGGINVNGSEGHAEVDLMHDVLIVNNTATTSGGGIRVEGNARLFALAPQTLIGLNHALGGYGGGLEVLEPASADIGSPGYNGTAVIQFNDAQHGGGAAIVADGNEIDGVFGTTLRIFSTDSQHPVQIANNNASATGGGVYLKPNAQILDFGVGATFCAYDFSIHDNAAVEGAALYADTDSGGMLTLGTDIYMNVGYPGCGPESPQSLGAVPCAPGTRCNDISDNIAADTNGDPTPGSIVLLQTNSEANARRVVFAGNTGDHVVRGVADDDFTRFNLTQGLFAENTVTGSLIQLGPGNGGDSDNVLNLDGCTIANNVTGSAYVIDAGVDRFGLTNSIIDQPGVETLNIGSGPQRTIAYILTNDVSTLTGGSFLREGEPDFIDWRNGDYHLQRTSAGVDFAPGETDTDLDGLPRTVDLIDLPNGQGAMDLGAYEIQTQIATCAIGDTIFCNGFDP